MRRTLKYQETWNYLSKTVQVIFPATSLIHLLKTRGDPPAPWALFSWWQVLMGMGRTLLDFRSSKIMGVGKIWSTTN